MNGSSSTFFNISPLLNLMNLATTLLQQLRNMYRRFQHCLGSTSRTGHHLEELSLRKQQINLRLRRWRQSRWNSVRYSVQLIRSKLRRGTRSALRTIALRRSRWSHVSQKSTYEPRGSRSYRKSSRRPSPSFQRLSITRPSALHPAPRFTVTQNITVDATDRSTVAQHMPTPLMPLPMIPEEGISRSDAASDSSFRGTGIFTSLSQLEDDEFSTSSLSPLPLTILFSPRSRHAELSPERDVTSVFEDNTWTSPWSHPASQGEIYTKACTPSNSTDSLYSISPLSQLNNPGSVIDIQRDVWKIEEVKAEILRHFAALRPLLSIDQVCKYISAIDHRWWEKHAENIDTFVLSGSDIDKVWLRAFCNTREYFDTVAYISGDSTLPDQELEFIFMEAMLKCDRAVIIAFTPSSGLMAGHYPKIDFTGSLPWSQLQELQLDCPVTDKEAYHLLHEGRRTLKTISLNLTESVILNDVADSPIALEQLQSLFLRSQVDLKKLFHVGVDFPALQELDLDGFTDFLPNGSIPWHKLKRLNLKAPVDGVYALDSILSRCHSLTFFGWTGPSSRFTLSGNEEPLNAYSTSLEGVYIVSDRVGCLDLGNFLQLNEMKIVSLTMSHFTPNFPLTLERFKILNGVDLEELDGILQKLCHVIHHGSFVVDLGNDAFTPTPCVFKNLTTLTLKTCVALDSFCDIFEEAKHIRRIVIKSTNPMYTPDVAHLRNYNIRKALRVA